MRYYDVDMKFTKRKRLVSRLDMSGMVFDVLPTSVMGKFRWHVLRVSRPRALKTLRRTPPSNRYEFSSVRVVR